MAVDVTPVEIDLGNDQNAVETWVNTLLGWPTPNPSWQVRNVVFYLQQVHSDLYFLTSAISRTLADLKAVSWDLYLDAIGYTGQQVNALRSAIGQTGATATNVAASYADAAQVRAENYAATLFDRANAESSSFFLRSETDIRTALADAQTWAAEAQNRAEAVAASYFARSETDIRTALADAQTWAAEAQDRAETFAVDLSDRAAADLAATTNTLQGEIHNAVVTSEDYALRVGGVAETQAVAQTLAQVQPQLDKITAELDDCVAPLCDTVTPAAPQLGRLGQLLKGVESLGVAGLLMALVAEAVADPVAAAGQVVDATGWVPGVATEAADAILG